MNERIKVYTPYVANGEIRVDWRWSRYPKGQYTSDQEAREAILVVFPRAFERFNMIRDRIRQMEHDLDFEVTYTMDGDTHGIYEDHLDVDFRMDGFNFSFSL